MEKLLTVKDKKYGTYLNLENIKQRLILDKLETEVTPSYTAAVASG